MTVEADDPIRLPPAPPPRPAARKEALQAALRKFDGLEEVRTGRTIPRRSGWLTWGTTGQRAAGAVAAVALVLVVSLPNALNSWRERPPTSETIETRAQAPAIKTYDVASCTGSNCGSGEAVSAGPADASQEQLAFEPRMPANRPHARAPAQEVVVTDDPVSTRAALPVAAMAANAPPSAPPPPSAAPSRSAESSAQLAEALGGDDIVVTGSRAQGLSKSGGVASDYAATQASPAAMIDRTNDFLSELRAALRAGDRRGVIRLTALPLRVLIGGEPVIYRSAADVERNFDRIFTPAVKSSLIGQSRETLGNDGRRMIAVGRVRIGLACASSSCSPTSPIRIREVMP